MICSASSASSTFAIKRPHDPIGGFRTAGYRLLEAEACEDLVAAQRDDLVPIHCRDAVVFEESQGVQGTAVAHAAIQDQIRLEAVPDEGERHGLVMEALHRDATFLGGREDPFLLRPDHGVEQAEGERLTHPSPPLREGPRRRERVRGR